MREHVNPVAIVQKHLSSLEDKFGDTESICNRCGDCCHATIKAGNTLLVVPDLPCKHLTLNDDGDFHCKVYVDRFSVAPWCRDLMTGALTGSYPESCPYVKSMIGYVGGKKLSSGQYAAIKSDVVDVIKNIVDINEFSKCFRKTDLDFFFGGNSFSVLESGVSDVDPNRWLSVNFPNLNKNAYGFVADKLIKLLPVRQYFRELDIHDIADFITEKSYFGEDFIKSLKKLVNLICDFVGHDDRSTLHKAAKLSCAYSIISDDLGGFYSSLLNKWLLEGADLDIFAPLINKAFWYRCGELLPISMDEFILGKSLELNELYMRDLHMDGNAIKEDLLLFKALSSYLSIMNDEDVEAKVEKEKKKIRKKKNPLMPEIIYPDVVYGWHIKHTPYDE